MASLAELREKRRKLADEQKALEKEYAQAYERELCKARAAVEQKIEDMSDEEKEAILSHMEHTRSSCDDHVAPNGYSSHRERWDCPKCMMIEILNGEHGGRFDFRLAVEIFEVQV